MVEAIHELPLRLLVRKNSETTILQGFPKITQFFSFYQFVIAKSYIGCGFHRFVMILLFPE